MPKMYVEGQGSQGGWNIRVKLTTSGYDCLIHESGVTENGNWWFVMETAEEGVDYLNSLYDAGPHEDGDTITAIAVLD